MKNKFRDLAHLCSMNKFSHWASIEDSHKEEIEKMVFVFDKMFFYNNFKLISDFIEYNVEGPWIKRVKMLKSNFNRDSSSLESFKLRFGDNHGLVKWRDKTNKTTQNLESFIKKFGKNKGVIEYEKYKKSKKSIGIDIMKARYGNKVGAKKWENYLSKWKKSIEEKNGWDNGLSLYSLQKKHGTKKGYDIWKKRSDYQSYRFSKSYYINTFGKKRGEIEWEKYCSGMDRGSLQYFISKFGKEGGKVKYCENLRKISEHLLKGNTFSRKSQDLFWKIYYSFDSNERGEMFFSELNNEVAFYFNQDQVMKFFMVDFKFNNKIIEFYGDYWHANPEKYHSKQIVKLPGDKRNLLAEDIWRKDENRINFLINKGYETKVVWESDYKRDQNKVLSECIKFLKNKS